MRRDEHSHLTRLIHSSVLELEHEKDVVQQDAAANAGERFPFRCAPPANVMKTSRIQFVETMPKRWVVFLTLAAIYAPYCWLWAKAEWVSWIQIWPLLPGLAISALIRSLPSGPDFPLLFTALLLGISLLTVLKARKLFWPAIAGLFALSCALSWIVYLLMKA